MGGMEILLLADIHSNFEALKAVFEDSKDVDEVWCLGDVVGYGPSPNQCCQLIKKGARYSLLGNHDRAVLGKADMSWFNPFAAEAVKINQTIFKEENYKFLENLKEAINFGEIRLVHGSPQNPVFGYIFTPEEARDAFLGFKERVCFVGHTHCPCVFEERGGEVWEIPIYPNEKLSLRKNSHYIINPGSVGQPRDGDSRASFLLFDDETLSLELRRVKYPIRKTQEEMKKLGLPDFLIQRLTFGR